MTMKKWRFMPILAKEEVLKNMDISDRLSLSTYCNTSRKLLRGIPNHLSTAKLIDGFFVIDDQLVSREVFCSLVAYRSSSIQRLGLFVESLSDKSTIDEIFEKEKLMKVRHLEMRFHAEFYESCKELLEICDPSMLRTIEIPRFFTNRIYDSIVNTEQWKSCNTVLLNTDSSARHSSSLQVNYDHFSHFKTFSIGVDSLSVDDAWKLCQMYMTFTEIGHFRVTTRQRFQNQEIMDRIYDEDERAVKALECLILLQVPAIPLHTLAAQSHHFSFIGVIRHLFHRYRGRQM